MISRYVGWVIVEIPSKEVRIFLVGYFDQMVLLNFTYKPLYVCQDPSVIVKNTVLHWDAIIQLNERIIVGDFCFDFTKVTYVK